MKIFIIGCGSIGIRHVQNLQALGIHDISVFDIDVARMKNLVNKYNVVSVDSIEKGIDLKPDIAMICLPNNLHIETAIPLAKEGIHLFIEKPLDISLKKVNDLIIQIQKLHLVDMVACNFRFDAGLKTLKEIMNEGGIGTPWSLRAQFGFYLPDWRPNIDYRKNYAVKREMGGGVILDRIHEIDYVIWLFGAIQGIYGYAARLGQLDIETEDNADIILKHVNGRVSNIHLDYLRRDYCCTCEVIGSEGILSWNFKERTLRRYVAKTRIWMDYSNVIPGDINDMYLEELRYYIDHVQKRSSTQNPVEHAAQVLRWTLDIKKMVAHQ